jgi:hypothetical protein
MPDYRGGMAHVLTLTTSKFDISREAPNPINPIAGQGILSWIRSKLEGTSFVATVPEPEDWGWYMDVAGPGATYLVGASGEAEGESHDVDWTIQVHKHRTAMEKLTGRNKLTDDDPLVSLLAGIFRETPGFRDVEIEKES